MLVGELKPEEYRSFKKKNAQKNRAQPRSKSDGKYEATENSTGKRKEFVKPLKYISWSPTKNAID